MRDFLRQCIIYGLKTSLMYVFEFFIMKICSSKHYIYSKMLNMTKFETGFGTEASGAFIIEFVAFLVFSKFRETVYFSK